MGGFAGSVVSCATRERRVIFFLFPFGFGGFFGGSLEFGHRGGVERRGIEQGGEEYVCFSSLGSLACRARAVRAAWWRRGGRRTGSRTGP